MNEKAKKICEEFTVTGCGKTCPLAKPCAMQGGDTREIWTERMNKAANSVIWPMSELERQEAA